MATTAATTAATFVATTTAASAATAVASGGLKRVEEFVNLFLGCGTRLYHATHKLKVTTGQRVVEVHHHLHGGNLFHCAEDGRAVAAHHFHNVAVENVCRVELSVDGKHLAVKILNVVGVILAVCLGRGDYKVKSIAFIQVARG